MSGGSRPPGERKTGTKQLAHLPQLTRGPSSHRPQLTPGPSSHRPQLLLGGQPWRTARLSRLSPGPAHPAPTRSGPPERGPTATLYPCTTVASSPTPHPPSEAKGPLLPRSPPSHPSQVLTPWWSLHAAHMCLSPRSCLSHPDCMLLTCLFLRIRERNLKIHEEVQPAPDTRISRSACLSQSFSLKAPGTSRLAPYPLHCWPSRKALLTQAVSCLPGHASTVPGFLWAHTQSICFLFSQQSSMHYSGSVSASAGARGALRLLLPMASPSSTSGLPHQARGSPHLEDDTDVLAQRVRFGRELEGERRWS